MELDFNPVFKAIEELNYDLNRIKSELNSGVWDDDVHQSFELFEHEMRNIASKFEEILVKMKKSIDSVSKVRESDKVNLALETIDRELNSIRV